VQPIAKPTLTIIAPQATTLMAEDRSLESFVRTRDKPDLMPRSPLNIVHIPAKASRAQNRNDVQSCSPSGHEFVLFPVLQNGVLHPCLADLTQGGFQHGHSGVRAFHLSVCIPVRLLLVSVLRRSLQLDNICARQKTQTRALDCRLPQSADSLMRFRRCLVLI
jgi:hypothetical protein